VWNFRGYTSTPRVAGLEDREKSSNVVPRAKNRVMNHTDVFLLELSGQVSLHEGSLADTSITDQNKLELRNSRLGLHKRRNKAGQENNQQRSFLQGSTMITEHTIVAD
jgi:hypothetical protein